MMRDESPRVALVTGAARGIGAATVRVLCARGYRVVALDSCASDGARPTCRVDYPLATRENLELVGLENPGAVLTHVADVRDPDAMAAAARLALDTFGRLDAVVAAAAVIAGGARLWETSEEQLQSLWDVNVRGVWNTAAACVPQMLTSADPSGGRFVGVASAAGTRGLLHLAGYGAAKHAVVGLVRGLAADLVGTGVTAVAVAPGSTRTDMLQATAHLYDLDDVEDFAKVQLLHRLMDPVEIAATIAFCCSVDGAALNGSVVSADGGFGG